MKTIFTYNVREISFGNTFNLCILTAFNLHISTKFYTLYVVVRAIKCQRRVETQGGDITQLH